MQYMQYNERKYPFQVSIKIWAVGSFCSWLSSVPLIVNIPRQFLLSTARQKGLTWTCCFRSAHKNSNIIVIIESSKQPLFAKSWKPEMKVTTNRLREKMPSSILTRQPPPPAKNPFLTSDRKATIGVISLWQISLFNSFRRRGRRDQLSRQGGFCQLWRREMESQVSAQTSDRPGGGRYWSNAVKINFPCLDFRCW